MFVKVKFLSFYEKLAGKEETLVELQDGSDMNDLFQLLARMNPELSSALRKATISINLNNADRQTVLAEGDVVVFLPVLGGG